VGGENQCAFARIARRQIVPDVQPVVGHAARKAAIEESAHPHILGAGAAEIYVRGAQDALAFGGGLFGERNLEIADSDSTVPFVEAMEDQGARDSQFVKYEVRQQAEHVQSGDQHPEDKLVLEAEFQSRALRSPEREREVGLLRPVGGQVGWSGTTTQYLAGRFIQIAAVYLWIC